jgi:hypothetical protein
MTLSLASAQKLKMAPLIVTSEDWSDQAPGNGFADSGISGPTAVTRIYRHPRTAIHRGRAEIKADRPVKQAMQIVGDIAKIENAVREPLSLND